MVTAVGFDLDGTLFDYEGAAAHAVGEFLAERGWSHSGDPGAVWRELEALHFRPYADGSISFQEQRRRRILGLVESVGLDVDSFDADALFDEYLDHYRRGWTPYPDVAANLDALRSMGLGLAVLTNGDQEQQEDKLRRMGILDEFDVVLAAGALPAFKPSPLAFEALCSALALPAASVLYVGDDLTADIHGALTAGLMPLWIDRDRRGGGPAGVPTITSLDELPGHVRTLRG